MYNIQISLKTLSALLFVCRRCKKKKKKHLDIKTTFSESVAC